MKMINFKGRKHTVTAACLLLGMCMLTTAVYANYDNAKGYTNYKNAIKDLVFYNDNYTGEGSVTMLVDGKAIATMEGEMKIDGQEYFMRSATRDEITGSSDEYESLQWGGNGKSYSYYPSDNTYYEGEGYFRTDMNDPTMKKAIRFTELLADTMVGDLKNNFVLTSGEDGNKSYSVNVSGSQIPEVVNAGISFMFTAANSGSSDNEISMVNYEDYSKSFQAYYTEQTGIEMTEAEAEEQDWSEDIEKINEQFYEKYQDILEANGGKGVVYVEKDGGYQYFATYKEYTQSNIGMQSFDAMTLLGSDPYLDNGVCNFTLDTDGNLISNDMEASMVGEDKDGTKHTVTMKIEFKCKDYGSTTIDKFDPTGKIKKN